MSLPNIDINLLDQPTLEKVQAKALDHPPRILLLYGSNRERSYNRLAVKVLGLNFPHLSGHWQVA